MAKRTLADARQTLADLAPTLNPEMYRRLEQEVEAARHQGHRYANGFITNGFASADTRRAELLVEACSVRDELDALEAEGAAGMISAAEYAQQLEAIETRRTRVDRDYAETVRAVEELTTVEDDPDAWVDDVFRRYPNLMPEFSF